MVKDVILRKGNTILLSALATIALLLTMINVNSGCLYISHQDEIPNDAMKLRKF